MPRITAEECAREIVDGDEETRLKFEIGLLDVPEEVAQAADRLIATREKQRAASLRLAAAANGTQSTVRRLRQERGWSQRDLSRASGVSPRSVFAAEATPALVSRDTLAKIARALGTTADALR
jgi:ribosome-binding protein aMBF1 (putative translation factor)